MQRILRYFVIRCILGKEVCRFLESPDLLPQNLLEHATPASTFLPASNVDLRLRRRQKYKKSTAPINHFKKIGPANISPLYLYVASEVRALNLAPVDGQHGVLAHEARDDVRPAADGRQQHVALQARGILV